MTEKQRGFDASHWQGEGGVPLDWMKRLVDCGAKFAFFKATQGTSYVDPSWDDNRERAERLGLLVGAYHFTDNQNGTRQADHFIRTVRRTGSIADLPLAVDAERVPTPTPRDDPKWPAIRALAKRLRIRAKRSERVLYTSSGYWHAIGNPDAAGLFDMLWQARWDGVKRRCTRTPFPPRPPRAGFGGWGTTKLWQYGSWKMVVGGDMQGIDGNVYYGTQAQLKEAFTGTAPRPPLASRPNFIAGYNATIAAAVEDLLDTFVPPGPPGVAYPAGVEAATEDLKEMLKKLRLKGR